MRADVEIAFDARAETIAMLSRIGRTEDARFSPDNRRLALVCLDRSSIAVAEVEISTTPGPTQVTFTGVTELRSTSLKTPHGVEFLDDDRILVANRYGRLLAFRLPAPGTKGDDTELVPVELPPEHGFGLLGGPGSVRVVGASDGRLEVLVCDNRRSTVTRHELRKDPLRVVHDEVLLRRLLDFPDGVAVTPDHEWIAVSNHDAHVVFVYRWTPSLSEHSEPECILRGTMYPHGLQFSADGLHLFVADAGSPHVNVYTRTGGEWRGVANPTRVRAMSDDVFALGRDHESRGPKGLSLDRTGRVLVVTYENRPLALLDACQMLEADALAPDDDSAQLEYEIESIEAAQARLAARTAVLMGSTSFRITKPLRTVYAMVNRKRR